MTAFAIRKLNQRSFVFVEQNSVLSRILGMTFAYFNARQTSATRESTILNAGDAVGDCVMTAFAIRKLN